MPELIVWLGTCVGFEHCAARTAAIRLQAQNQSASRTVVFPPRANLGAVLMSFTLLARCGRAGPRGHPGRMRSKFQIADSDLLNHRVEVVENVLAVECVELLREFFEKRR